jgi:hypothetical protein
MGIEVIHLVMLMPTVDTESDLMPGGVGVAFMIGPAMYRLLRMAMCHCRHQMMMRRMFCDNTDVRL